MITSTRIAQALQAVLNLGLLFLGAILLIFMVKESISMAKLLLVNNGDPSYMLIDSVVTYFLYFEFTALIVKYFQSGYHFPLRYFIYIGITAIIRLIIVDHDSAMNTLLFSGAILLLVMTLWLANSQRLKRE